MHTVLIYHAHIHTHKNFKKVNLKNAKHSRVVQKSQCETDIIIIIIY